MVFSTKQICDQNNLLNAIYASALLWDLNGIILSLPKI